MSETTPVIKLVETLQLKAYSPKTIRTYTNEFQQLVNTLNGRDVDELSPERLRDYFLYCVNTLKLSEATLHSRINAVKFYYEQVLRRDKMFIQIPRPKKAEKLPQVLNIEEVKRLFQVTENLKHNTMLKLCYGMGLRVSEITTLKVAHIDSKVMRVFIRLGRMESQFAAVGKFYPALRQIFST